MIDLTKDIHSMTTFKRNSSGLMKSMRKTGRPLVLTVKGKAEAVVLDAAAYQEVADHLDSLAGIRRGLAQAKKGRAVLLTRCLTAWNTKPISSEE
jgi:prevent-host-death family protein